jgi:hypothetical protein
LATHGAALEAGLNWRHGYTILLALSLWAVIAVIVDRVL